METRFPFGGGRRHSTAELPPREVIIRQNLREWHIRSIPKH